MALSINKNMSRAAVLAALEAATAEHPGLAELYAVSGEGDEKQITSPLSVAQLVLRADEVVAGGGLRPNEPTPAPAPPDGQPQGTPEGTPDVDREQTPEADEADPADEAPAPLTNEDRMAEFAQLVRQAPDTILVPVREAYIRLQETGTRRARNIFVLTLMPGRMGSTSVSLASTRPALLEPDHQYSAPAPVPAGRLASEVPRWAYAEMHELVEKGEVRMFTDRAALELHDWSPRREHYAGGILAQDGGKVGIELTKEQQGFSTPKILFKAVGRFTRPEQSCAWAVLNEVVRGEAPLPELDGDISSDFDNVTQQELLLVERRIRDCLANPAKYTTMQVSRDVFDVTEFFSSLVKYEMKGMNPKRIGTGSPQGDTRRQVMQLFRSICEEFDLQIVANYVRKTPDRAFTAGMVPNQPLAGSLYDAVETGIR